MSKIDVALCITDLEVGGAERCMVNLATRLDRERFTPVVYCLKPRPMGENSLVPVLESADIAVHFLNMRKKLSVFGALRKLERLLRQQAPDVIQSFLFHANILGRIAGRKAKVPCVLSSIRVAERKKRWHLVLDRFTSKKVDRYVCVSESVAQFSANTAHLPEKKLVVIPNGIDRTEYPVPPIDLQQFGVSANARVVCFVGRLEPQKDVGWLIETASNWLNRLPNCELLIVGRGSEETLLEQQVLDQGDQGIGDRVHFAGWRSDVPQILAAVDLLVLPSQWEGMPNVVLEAMASGLPVVSTDVEGVSELLGPNAKCQTAPHRNTQVFAENVVTIMLNKTLADQLGQQNRKRIVKHFDLESSVRAYENLWTSLVERKKST